jgi:hypothetical protein
MGSSARHQIGHEDFLAWLAQLKANVCASCHAPHVPLKVTGVQPIRGD